MQIIQQLSQPKPHFVVQSDGTETVDWRPPTALDLRAARTIQELVLKLQGLERAIQTQNTHNTNVN